MIPQGVYGQPGAAPVAGGAPTMQEQVAQAQMRAVQQSMPQGFGGNYTGYGGYQGYPSPVPGGGAADGGWSAAYGSWVQQGYGGQGQQPQGLAQHYQQQYQRPQQGFKGKGSSKGKKGSSPDGAAGDAWKAEAAGTSAASDDPRKMIELAQRRARQRDKGAIQQAQKSAAMRFEKDIVDRLQGQWYDASDPIASYVVEGSMCHVSAGENARIFRNRLVVFNGELCWDAKRYWHKLNMDSLPPLGEEVESLEWSPGEGSPPPKAIVWQRKPLEGAALVAAASNAEAKGEAKEEAPASELAAAEPAPVAETAAAEPAAATEPPAAEAA